MGRAHNQQAASALSGFDVFGRRGVAAGVQSSRDRAQTLGGLAQMVKSLPLTQVQFDIGQVIAARPTPSEPFYEDLVSALGDRLVFAAGHTRVACEALTAAVAAGQDPGPALFDALKRSVSTRRPDAGEAQLLMKALTAGAPPSDPDPHRLGLSEALAQRLLTDGRYTYKLLKNAETRADGEEERRNLEGTASGCALALIDIPAEFDTVVGPVLSALEKLREHVIDDHSLIQAIKLCADLRAH